MIIVPVHNFYLEETILKAGLVIDDASEAGQANTLQSLCRSHNIPLLRNRKQEFFNYTVNVAVDYALSQGATHLTVLNSDAILPPNYHRVWELPTPFKGPAHHKFPGFCFSFEAASWEPIPSSLIHWCGDDWLALKGWSTHPEVVVKHLVTKSSTPNREYYFMVRGDLLEFERLTGISQQDKLKGISAWYHH